MKFNFQNHQLSNEAGLKEEAFANKNLFFYFFIIFILYFFWRPKNGWNIFLYEVTTIAKQLVTNKPFRYYFRKIIWVGVPAQIFFFYRARRLWANVFWDQSNNFWLKWSFCIIKQNAINQKFQKFICKPQLADCVCSFAWMASLTSRHNSLTI